MALTLVTREVWWGVQGGAAHCNCFTDQTVFTRCVYSIVIVLSCILTQHCITKHVAQLLISTIYNAIGL